MGLEVGGGKQDTLGAKFKETLILNDQANARLALDNEYHLNFYSLGGSLAQASLLFLCTGPGTLWSLVSSHATQVLISNWVGCLRSPELTLFLPVDSS